MKALKKLLTLLVVITLSLAMVACSASGDVTSGDSTSVSLATTTDSEKAKMPSRIAWSSGPSGGTTYLFGTKMVDVIQKAAPGTSAMLLEGGSVANITVIHKGEAHMGHSSSDTLKAAVEGVAPFSEPIDNVKSIARVMDMHLVFVATKASGITSIEDIGTKKNVNLVTAQKGSSAEILISRILEEYGFNYETVNANGGTVSHQGTGDAAMLMQDGHADVFAALTNTPAPAIMEISATRDLVYLSIDEDIIQKMVDELGYAPAEIPAGTYKDQNEPIKTLSSPIVAICSADLPDEFVYEFAKLLYQEETIKDLAAIHVSFGELTVESGCEHLGAPLHPGAEKYYKEVLQK